MLAAQVEVPHTDLTEVTRMVFVEVDAVMVHATSVTATSGMLAVLADTTMTVADVTTQLPGLLPLDIRLKRNKRSLKISSKNTKKSHCTRAENCQLRLRLLVTVATTWGGYVCTPCSYFHYLAHFHIAQACCSLFYGMPHVCSAAAAHFNLFMHIAHLFRLNLNATTRSNVHSPSSEFWKERSEQSWLRFVSALDCQQKGLYNTIHV